MMAITLLLGLIILALVIMVVVFTRAIRRQSNRDNRWIVKEDENGRIIWQKLSNKQKESFKQ